MIRIVRFVITPYIPLLSLPAPRGGLRHVVMGLVLPIPTMPIRIDAVQAFIKVTVAKLDQPKQETFWFLKVKVVRRASGSFSEAFTPLRLTD
jgi:hypothetical protein